MNDAVIIAECEKLAQRLGIKIRDTEGGPCGLCTVKGERVFFFDKTLGQKEQIELFAREFKTLDLEGIFVVPVIRNLMDKDNEIAEW